MKSANARAKRRENAKNSCAVYRTVKFCVIDEKIRARATGYWMEIERRGKLAVFISIQNNL
jgi:hypothetical protein